MFSLPLILFACTTVTFEEPQPSGKENIYQFPKPLLGHYFDYDNNNHLFIEDSLIYTVSYNTDTINIKASNENTLKKSDSIFNPKKAEFEKPVFINDSLITNYYRMDTIFHISYPDLVLKKDGEDYFLNKKMEAKEWVVSKLSRRDKVINLSEIRTMNEVKMMEEITGEKGTHSKITVKPTREQLNKFIAQNGFIEGSTWIKVDSIPVIIK